MAIIKFGMMMTDARGKLGGHVLSKNRGGNYVRTNNVPSNPQSNFQTGVRAAFAAISSGWSGLTVAQRAGWNNAVSKFERTNVFGDRKVLSGKALFQSLNTELINSERPIIDDAPTTEAINGLQAKIKTAALVTGTLKLALDAIGKATADAKIVVQATSPVSAGTYNAKNKFRTIQIEDSVEDAAIDIASTYKERFGNPPVGTKVFVRVKVVAKNGQASPYSADSAIIA